MSLTISTKTIEGGFPQTNPTGSKPNTTADPLAQLPVQNTAQPTVVDPVTLSQQGNGPTALPEKTELTIENFNRKIQYDIDPETNEVIASVFDPVTDQLIRQIPGEEAQELNRRINEYVKLLKPEEI